MRCFCLENAEESDQEECSMLMVLPSYCVCDNLSSNLQVFCLSDCNKSPSLHHLTWWVCFDRTYHQKMKARKEARRLSGAFWSLTLHRTCLGRASPSWTFWSLWPKKTPPHWDTGWPQHALMICSNTLTTKGQTMKVLPSRLKWQISKHSLNTQFCSNVPTVCFWGGQPEGIQS